MDIINRFKNMLITPKNEWDVVEKETGGIGKMFTGYVVFLLIIPTVCAFIGMGFIGYKVFFLRVVGVEFGIKTAIIVAGSMVGTYFATSYLIDALATSFKGQKNIAEASKLTAYSLTAASAAGVLFLIPSLYALGILGALYGLYIMYLGITKTMKVPAEQAVPYMLVGGLGMVLIYYLVSLILSRILFDVGGAGLVVM